MMTAAKEAQLVSIYVSEDTRIRGKPVYMAVLELLRANGAAGAIVVRGVAGFDRGSAIHSAGVVSLSAELPIKIEWVDSQVRVDALLPSVKQLVDDGLITVQEVTMVKRTALGKTKALKRRVSAVMSPDVLAVGTDTPLAEAVSLLLREGYRSLPVIDAERRVVGIVTDGDLLRNTSLPIRLGLQSGLTKEQVQSDITELQAESRMVGEIMTMPVVTVADSASVRQAGATMVERDLKRLPVVDTNGRLVGIISRFDILREMVVAVEHHDAAQVTQGQTIADLMAQDTPYIAPDANLEEILQALEHGRQQRVIVVDNSQQVVGLITDGDLMSRSMIGKHPSLLQRLRGLMAGTQAASFNLPTGHESAADLMTTPVITIHVNESLSAALRLMLLHQLKRLPVVDGDGKLLGVLGRASVLRGLMVE